MFVNVVKYNILILAIMKICYSGMSLNNFYREGVRTCFV